jgi:hypothetical protein
VGSPVRVLNSTENFNLSDLLCMRLTRDGAHQFFGRCGTRSRICRHKWTSTSSCGSVLRVREWVVIGVPSWHVPGSVGNLRGGTIKGVSVLDDGGWCSPSPGLRYLDSTRVPLAFSLGQTCCPRLMARSHGMYDQRKLNVSGRLQAGCHEIRKRMAAQLLGKF